MRGESKAGIVVLSGVERRVEINEVNAFVLEVTAVEKALMLQITAELSMPGYFRGRGVPELSAALHRVAATDLMFSSA